MLVFSFCISSFFAQELKKDYPIKPVPFTKVKLTDKFWAPRIKTDKDVTIPLAFRKAEETGRIKNFKIAGGLEKGKFCTQFPFDDSDVFKNIEAASYILQIYPDASLDAYLDTLISYIGAAQEDDGYLFTNRTIDPDNMHEWVGKKRWEKTIQISHELYNVGHLYEAAAAHYLATGKRSLLNIALKNADLVCNDIGWGKLETVPGHPVIEMGLIKLYRITNDEKYLNQAKYFVDKRGTGETVKLGTGIYAQMHKPFFEQDSAVGHAVRAEYLYSGATDVAALTGDNVYVKALDKIWEDIVYRKMYITGGTGAQGEYEGFGPAYELPNLSAYCETCAQIADIFWNYRMFLLKGEAKYFDVLERILYNGFLSGISLSGDRFFYPNPLASMANYERSEWFGCACCPVNFTRTLPSIQGYVYATNEKGIYVNLFIQNNSEVEFRNQVINLNQQTNYPWNGKISVEVNPEKSEQFSFMVRIPGWAREEVVPGDLYSFKKKINLPVKIFVNDKEVSYKINNGYAEINREWNKGDKIMIDIPMPVREILANEKVAEDKDRIAIQRGPIVYCAEGIDNPNNRALNILIDNNPEYSTEFKNDLLNGVQVIKANAKGTKKITESEIGAFNQGVTLIPYYAWANRGMQEMNVWFATKSEITKPIPYPTIANTSKISSSHKQRNINSLNDQLEPANSNDHSIPYFHWWPKKDCTEWLQYDFAKEEEISSSSIYWFDDEPDSGGCRIPALYKLLYKSGEDWKPVEALNEYKIEKDKFNVVDFKKVKTTALRLEVTLKKDWASGVYEWIIK
ncbi:MAG: glycoside hydrolase family 127 protein [Ignavibacteriales bacterium]|nr:MAG: glycoside hydrolase family 127 protein [Ignavibacteriales bacterium]